MMSNLVHAKPGGQDPIHHERRRLFAARGGFIMHRAAFLCIAQRLLAETRIQASLYVVLLKPGGSLLQKQNTHKKQKRIFVQISVLKDAHMVSYLSRRKAYCTRS